MYLVLDSPAKLNLTLRIVNRRNDGMHDICSLFMRLPSVEKLTFRMIDHNNVSKDTIKVYGQVVTGRNILEKVLETARKKLPHIPFMEIGVWKSIPPGSGLGAGSGNAAVLAGWLAKELGVVFSERDICDLGADVPFLFEGPPYSFRSGVGEIQVKNEFGLSDRFSTFVIIPEWSSETGIAYRMADEHYRDGGWRLSAGEALREAESITSSLAKGERVGLLPNDFTPVLFKTHPEYASLFKVAESAGSLAWGISGSGSALFCLFEKGREDKMVRTVFGNTGLVRKFLELR
jgi:4-diphosphocytidyl-2-C-methyl-D-erythritol kinase